MHQLKLFSIAGSGPTRAEVAWWIGRAGRGGIVAGPWPYECRVASHLHIAFQLLDQDQVLGPKQTGKGVVIQSGELSLLDPLPAILPPAIRDGLRSKFCGLVIQGCDEVPPAELAHNSWPINPVCASTTCRTVVGLCRVSIAALRSFMGKVFLSSKGRAWSRLETILTSSDLMTTSRGAAELLSQQSLFPPESFVLIDPSLRLCFQFHQVGSELQLTNVDTLAQGVRAFRIQA